MSPGIMKMALGIMMALLPIVSAQKCIHNGNAYKDGEIIPDVCAYIVCANGQWIFKGVYNELCGQCYIRDDPYIHTFDGYGYMWHQSCNYSISQLKYDYYPKFGIYSQYQPCNGISCHDVTTFTDNPHAVIEINHFAGPSVHVNGDPYHVQSIIEGLPVGDPTQPILAWEDGNCNNFLGSQGFLLITCLYLTHIFAHPNLAQQVNGLCGFFDFDVNDDLTARDGTVYPLSTLPFAFPYSWLTAEQSVKECPPPEKLRDGDKNDAEDPCKADEGERQELRELCESLFREVDWYGHTASEDAMEMAIMGCISDLCNMRQSGASDDALEEWKRTMQDMLKKTIEVEARTRG